VQCPLTADTFATTGRFAVVPLLADLLDVLDSWYDPGWAETWDAVGLVCGDRTEAVDRVLLAVDPVPATVCEAINGGSQLLVTHHPLLLTAVHGVPADDPKGALVHRMIRAGVAHFVAHTNADVANPGVSDALAERIGLTGLRPLVPPPALGAASRGSGRVGELAGPMSLREFTAHVAGRLPATAWGVRSAGDPDRAVRTVAVCGGSGGSYADDAVRAGVDAFVTADLKHHATLEAVTERGLGAMALVDAAHWATEAPWLDVAAARLRQHFGTTVDVRVSRIVTDPWTVHAPSTESSNDRT